MKLYTSSIVITLVAAATYLQAAEIGSNLGSVKGGDFSDPQAIISNKCTTCHTAQRIDAALSAKKDMVKIQQEMEKKGVTLSEKERDVMGIHWNQQSPLKQKKP